ncbi:MAG TPA: gamma-glutamyl-gamma-aminobutyrate hydrolase [Nitrospiraceae bacterium]|nr:gamma-glutamyl-gamma-aminobutyrate hydrolase [Nitrospiraceae bacterium]HBU05214.1 gamma-glutamyl-gamma-aminobutyrate hydrolase [Nitrospiraceae bacterium]
MLRPVIGITADIEDNRFKLNRDYAAAVENAGACPVLLAPLRNAADIALRIDGILVSGGSDLHPSYYAEDVNYEIKIVERDRSDFEFAVIHEIIKLKKPVLGICYGMQLINVAFGGSLYQDIRQQVPSAMEHREGWHTIKIDDNKLIDRGEFKVNSSHHQAVKAIGQRLNAIAFSPDGIAEAVCGEDYPFLLGVQWHPERLQDSLSEKIFRAFAEAAIEGK